MPRNDHITLRIELIKIRLQNLWDCIENKLILSKNPRKHKAEIEKLLVEIYEIADRE